ncbi:hypothetical protein GCM10027037_04910 [Mucilaginibacter koreensis]
MYHPFTIGETIKKAWDVIKKNYIVLIVFTMITFFCNVAIKFVSDSFYYESASASVILRLFIMLLEAYLTLSFYKLLLTLIDKEYYEFSFKDIVPSFKMALNAVTIGVIFIFIIGTVLFLNSRLAISEEVFSYIYAIQTALALYLSIRLIFCLCFIVDDDSGPIESLRQSFSVTRGTVLKLVALLLIIIFFVALILLVINAIITALVAEDSPVKEYMIEFGAILWFAVAFPTVQVMIITTYRKLVYSHQDVDDDVSETL